MKKSDSTSTVKSIYSGKTVDLLGSRGAFIGSGAVCGKPRKDGGLRRDYTPPSAYINKQKEVKKWKKKAIEYVKRKLVKNDPRSAKL